MSFTVLIVEHLIVGIQTGLWIVLLVLSLTGLQLKDFAELNKPGALLFVGVAICYPAGIVVDEIADQLLRGWSRRLRHKVFVQRGLVADPTLLELMLRSKDQFAKQYFEYMRARIRLCRSSALNCLLTTIALTVFLTARGKPSWILVPVPGVGIFAAACAIFAWKTISESFANKTADLSAVVGEKGRTLS